MSMMELKILRLLLDNEASRVHRYWRMSGRLACTAIVSDKCYDSERITSIAIEAQVSIEQLLHATVQQADTYFFATQSDLAADDAQVASLGAAALRAGTLALALARPLRPPALTQALGDERATLACSEVGSGVSSPELLIMIIPMHTLTPIPNPPPP
jgi:hypothetical protein